MELARKADTPPTYLTRTDFDRLLACVQEGWLRELVVFAVSTGLRQGEMLNLRWDAVDLQRRPIHIHSQSTFRTKIGRRRMIPINDTVCLLLSQRVQSQEGGRVFTRNGEPILPGYLQHQFKLAVRRPNSTIGSIGAACGIHIPAGWCSQGFPSTRSRICLGTLLPR
jgi:integrase